MLNNKTKYSFLLFFTILVCIVNAQQVYVEAGIENAYFKDYVNNLGEDTLDLNYSKPQELFLESGVRFNLYEDRLKGDLGVSYNKYQINTGYYAGNISTPLTYNLTYVSLKTGFNFSIVNEPQFKVQVHTHLSYDFLTSGTSKYKNVVNDLTINNDFDKTLLRYHRGLSLEYLVSDLVSTYVSYNIADSFKEKNQDSNIEEEYSLHTNAFSLGLLFSLNNSNNRCYGGF